jgi:hypothetical protein
VCVEVKLFHEQKCWSNVGLEVSNLLHFGKIEENHFPKCRIFLFLGLLSLIRRAQKENDQCYLFPDYSFTLIELRWV